MISIRSGRGAGFASGPPNRRRILVRALAGVAMAAMVALSAPGTALADAEPLGPDVTFNSTPVIDPSGLFMLSRGLDGSILYSPGTPSTNGYGDFRSFGQQIIGDPSGVTAPEGAQIFARDTGNQAITSLVVSYNFPTPFQVIPGLLISSEITAVKIPPRGAQLPTIRIFARDKDTGRVFTNLLVQGAPQGWADLGQFATSEISAAVVPSPGLDIGIRIVVRGVVNRLFSTVINNSTGAISGWSQLGDLFTTGNPTLANEGAMFTFRGNEVFARQNGSNAVFTWNFDNPGWVNLGGVATSDIAVSIAKDNGLQFYVRGTNLRIYLNRRPPGSTRFGGYVDLGGTAFGNPAASGGTATPIRTVADQFIVRGTDNRIYSRIQTNFVGGFTSYFAFGGPLHG
ncbi:hypothetical protein [Amycolatopsis azurea]|uniref:PLL-like beta propeller domain-containing protein n=1 Tax=Amycolatopsis azurea DSM 43854 TaxID=1238180 RepID=M2PPR1_9PSEU|nr:hypothetical protein [Amycolatopsis azurea]EMD26548.1 hypothetical protein C791_3392 [Amycolatopsis azurea DSM 43854]OOC05676.1 hypothetical protein B0293_15055 [Amycolatopsis azurea DSM 43854]